MKILTTQDLNVARTNHQSTNAVSSKDFRLNSKASNEAIYAHSPSFQGKGEIVDKVAKFPVKKWLEKLLSSEGFKKVIDMMDHEVVVQSAISCVVCMLLRPLTIMAIPNKKGKDDNKYAATHSISSGIVGVFSALLISFPFSKGNQKASAERYLRKLQSQGKDIKSAVEILKKMYPNLNTESIVDKVTGKIKPESEWLDMSMKKFSKDMKNVMMVARPTHLSEVSAETLKSLGADVDPAKLTGSFNDVVTRDGKKLSEVLKTKDMFIAIKEEGLGGSVKDHPDTNFFSLLHINKDFLKRMDPTIDIASIEKDGVRLHPSQWLKEDGTKWLDMDKIHISSYRETPRSFPVYTGEYRSPNGKPKYKAFQDNIPGQKIGEVPDELGSPIEESYLKADKEMEVKNKTITWFPDIITRPAVAIGTIALIPWVLKKVFHMEKGKGKVQAPVEQKVEQQPVKDATEKVAFKGQSDNDSQNSVSFKGNVPKPKQGLMDKIGQFFAKAYAEPLKFGQGWLQRFSEWAGKMPGNMTQHMATLGALITSGVYVGRTLTNDKLDKERRSTLALNQSLCWVVPTIGAYTVDSLLKKSFKNTEYLFRGIMNQQLATGKITEKARDKFIEKLPGRVRNVRTLTTLLTFTLIYRYITPVIVTPAANWLGDRMNARKHAKAEAKLAQEKV